MLYLHGTTSLSHLNCSVMNLAALAFRQTDVIRLLPCYGMWVVKAAKSDSYEFPGGSERYVAGHASDRNDASPLFSSNHSRPSPHGWDQDSPGVNCRALR